MNIEEKTRILKNLDTKSIMARINQYENELEKAMKNQAVFTSTNYNLITSRGNDCQAVKELIAETLAQVPSIDESGKKLTIAEKDNWILRQRKVNKLLSDMITKQREAAFVLDNYQIDVEMAKKRLEGLKGALALKTAQINFLASG